MSKSFSDAERHIIDIFKTEKAANKSFSFKGNDYYVNIIDKPTCSEGEPKTDIYIRATSSDSQYHEFKISFKKENAEFLENKITLKRAEQLLGSNWSNIITEATKNLHNAFRERPLIYKTKYGRTNQGSITLGWKFEILNKRSGALSEKLNLTQDQVIDVYSGLNLSDDKKNASVCDKIIKDSGIANYILFEDKSMTLNSMQDIINALIPIEEYVSDNPNVYFACKALNYRTFKDKYDGNRPLAVYVKWFIKNNKLAYELKFDNPLKNGGDLAYNKLNNALEKIGVSTTDELNTSNVEDPSIIYE